MFVEAESADQTETGARPGRGRKKFEEGERGWEDEEDVGFPGGGVPVCGEGEEGGLVEGEVGEGGW